MNWLESTLEFHEIRELILAMFFNDDIYRNSNLFRFPHTKYSYGKGWNYKHCMTSGQYRILIEIIITTITVCHFNMHQVSFILEPVDKIILYGNHTDVARPQIMKFSAIMGHYPATLLYVVVNMLL